jgi:GNAT superfamily N-acetyltransferase
LNPAIAASGASFVRAARASDAAELARIQVACWRDELTGVISAGVLGQITSDEALKQWEARWLEAITSPPTSRHRVFVAYSAEPAKTVVAGFASAGPATDPDRWPATDGQLYEMRVLPELSGDGHAGRLMHAVADTLAEDGFRTLSTWILEADNDYRDFLTDAGWATDGARGELDVGVATSVMRLQTAIGEYGGEPA